MHNEFVPLDIFLKPSQAENDAITLSAEPVEAPASPCTQDSISAARRFAAGLEDALERSVQQLIPKIAREILGRELRLEPADIAIIVADVLKAYSNDPIVSLRVHPDDVERLNDVGVPIHVDDTLCRGDLLVALNSGTIDLRLDSRVNHVVALAVQ